LEILKKKLTSNQALWEQLEESDKRTKILHQELIFTQKSLTQCEKIIDKLKEELKMSEHERIRLAQYRQNKG
jgi:multidrug resistance efflux pump